MELSKENIRVIKSNRDGSKDKIMSHAITHFTDFDPEQTTAQLYFKSYVFACILSVLVHIASFILATYFFFYVSWMLCSVFHSSKMPMNQLFQKVSSGAITLSDPILLIPVAIALFFLVLAEYSQERSLSQFFRFLFSKKRKFNILMFVFALGFSVLSIYSSRQGGNEGQQMAHSTSQFLTTVQGEIDDALRSRSATNGNNRTMQKKDAEIEYLRGKRDMEQGKLEAKGVGYGWMTMRISLFLEIIIILTAGFKAWWRGVSASEIAEANKKAPKTAKPKKKIIPTTKTNQPKSLKKQLS